MKIVLLGPAYPYRGGISLYIGLMAKHLSKRHEVTTVSFSLQYPKFLYRKEQKDYSSDTFKVPGTRYLLNTVNPLSWIRTAREINKLSPDLLIVQWWHPFFAPAYWSLLKLLKKSVKTIFCCHNVLPHEGFPCKRLLARMVLQQGDAYIVLSRQDETDLKSLLENPLYKYAIGPEHNAFRMRGIDKSQARRELGIQEEEKILLFFGFIRSYKGLKHLLKAMPAIIQHCPNLRLFVVGEFFEGNKQEYLDLIQKIGIPQEALTIVDGYLPDKEVEPYFAACDLVVLPYESATQSGIARIAYAFEKPVVATAVGGLPEVVLDGKTGYLVPPLEDEALANAVLRFFEKKNAASFLENIRQEADKYSWERMVDCIEELSKQCG